MELILSKKNNSTDHTCWQNVTLDELQEVCFVLISSHYLQIVFFLTYQKCSCKWVGVKNWEEGEWAEIIRETDPEQIGPGFTPRSNKPPC